MSEKRHKINKFANYHNITVRNSPAFDHHVLSQDRYLWVVTRMDTPKSGIRSETGTEYNYFSANRSDFGDTLR